MLQYLIQWCSTKCYFTALKNKFKNLIIPPHCNDEGLSLGALEYLRVKEQSTKFKLDNFLIVKVMSLLMMK